MLAAFFRWRGFGGQEAAESIESMLQQQMKLGFLSLGGIKPGHQNSQGINHFWADNHR